MLVWATPVTVTGTSVFDSTATRSSSAVTLMRIMPAAAGVFGHFVDVRRLA